MTFSLLVSGEIETAEFLCTKTIYCKYSYVYGSEWKQICGIEEGISSTAQCFSKSHKIVLNTPLEATFISNNPFNWPQIVLSCYGPDIFGNDVVRGYGVTFLPSTPGKTVRKVALFVPQSSTMIQKIIGFFTGRYAEFIDPQIISLPNKREVMKVSTKGFITLNFNVVLKDTKKLGYDVHPESLTKISECPLPNFEENELSTQFLIKNETKELNETKLNKKKENLELFNDEKIETVDEKNLSEELIKSSDENYQK